MGKSYTGQDQKVNDPNSTLNEMHEQWAHRGTARTTITRKTKPNSTVGDMKTINETQGTGQVEPGH